MVRAVKVAFEGGESAVDSPVKKKRKAKKKPLKKKAEPGKGLAEGLQEKGGMGESCQIRCPKCRHPIVIRMARTGQAAAMCICSHPDEHWWQPSWEARGSEDLPSNEPSVTLEEIESGGSSLVTDDWAHMLAKMNL